MYDILIMPVAQQLALRQEQRAGAARNLYLLKLLRLSFKFLEFMLFLTGDPFNLYAKDLGFLGCKFLVGKDSLGMKRTQALQL